MPQTQNATDNQNVPNATLSAVYLGDYVCVIRSGVEYKATVASLLAATSAPGSAGQFNFSTAANSGLIGAL